MKNRILVVDDSESNRELLKEILCDEYEILEAEEGKSALEIIKSEDLDGILLDLVMPEMDGFEVLKKLSADGVMKKIPVMIISTETTVESENRCFEYGVFDFIGRPFRPSIVQQRVRNMIKIYVYKNRLEEKVQEQTAGLRTAYEKLERQAQKLERMNKEIVDMLGTIVEFRDLESGEHVQRVKGYTRILAEFFCEKYPEYGITKRQIEDIVEASALHDLGKIAIPDKILLKPGRLTAEEFEYMKQHTVKGCELIDSVKVEWNDRLKDTCCEIMRYHHERYDGNGYPEGLKGDEIPIAAQLVSLSDVYDALTNERCYKKAYSKQKAYQMIEDGECGVFSPKLMEAFEQVREEFEAWKP